MKASRGTGLIMALLIVTAFALLMAGVWNLARALTRESVFEKNMAQAQGIAEAGMEDALHSLFISTASAVSITNKPFAGGSYTVTISTDNPPWVTSTGTSASIPVLGAAVRTVKARAQFTTTATQGTVANTAYTVAGTVNSYDSSVSTNPASFGSAALLWSNAKVTFTSGQVDVDGNVTYYSGTAPTAAEVSGTITKSTYTVAISSINGSEYASFNNNLTGISPQTYYTAATQTLSIPSGDTATLEPGIYYLQSLVVTGTLNVNNTTGTVTVFLAGDFDASGTSTAGKTVNLSGVPSRYQIYGIGAITLYLRSTTALQVYINAPAATVEVEQVVYGQILAATIDVKSGDILHYDVEFNNRVTHASWQPGTWSVNY